MNTVTSQGPVANSVYVVAPHNSYPVVPGTVPQVPLYPSNQPQVHVIPGNLPGFVPAMTEPPAQRVLKKGQVLGVSKNPLREPETICCRQRKTGARGRLPEIPNKGPGNRMVL